MIFFDLMAQRNFSPVDRKFHMRELCVDKSFLPLDSQRNYKYSLPAMILAVSG